MIDLMPNFSLFYQWGLFLTAFIVLNFLVFRPTLRLIAARRSATEGDEAKATDFQAKSAELNERIDDNLARARREGQEIIQRLRQDSEAESSEIILKARERMDEHLQQVRSQVERETKEAQLQLKQHAQGLAGLLASRVLGRKVGG